MACVTVERLDHCGRMAAVIQDGGLIERIDARLLPDSPEESTPGAAVAGRIITGWGFSNRPLSLTPPLFANTPRALVGREDVCAERCNHCTLGRTLDEVYAQCL